MLQWFLALRDLHNFNTSVEDFSSMFKKEWLDGGYIKPTPIDLNNPYFDKGAKKINVEGRLAIRKRAEGWLNKFYPKTIEENKQILDDYLTLCEDHHVKPVLFLPPNTKGYIEMYPKKLVDEFHVLLNGVMKKHPSAVFFNGWKIGGFTDDDFQDSDHLNIIGAAKFSYLLNDFIMKLERK